MSGSTVFSIGGQVSVTATGALTAALLEKYATQLQNASVTFAPASPTPGTIANPITLAAGLGGDSALVIPTTDSGVISIPAGYAFVVYEGTGTLVGNSPNLIGVIGDLNYGSFASPQTTGAFAVGLGTNSGMVVESAPGAAYGGNTGNEMVWAFGNSETFGFDTGFSTLVATGTGDAVSVDGAASLFAFTANAATFDLMGAGATVLAGSGSAITLGGGNALLVNGNGSQVTSITAGTGSDTIFAVGQSAGAGGVWYNGGTSASVHSMFIGGAGTSTVYTPAFETAFGGAGGEVMSVAHGSSLLFITDGESDTMAGAATSITGSTAQQTVWGSANEKLTVTGGLTGGTYILAGNNDQMNFMGAGGHAQVIGANFLTGNGGQDSLMMSSAGNDSLVLFSSNEFGIPHTAATITISNWQASDILDLTAFQGGGQTLGYTAQDAASAMQQLQAGNSFTLSDGTTVVFQGAKPTTIYHA